MLRHVATLIRNDINQFQQAKVNTQAAKTINPFAEHAETHRGGSMYESIMTNNENLQNQLSITEKVKKTLEEEIVQLKISHTTTVQDL